MDADILQRLGAAIKRRQHEVGLSQEKLAEKSGITRSFIIDVERGDTNISILSLCQITNSMGQDFATFAKSLKGARDEHA